MFWLLLVLPNMAPRQQLSRGCPEGNLLALPILLSVYGQTAILLAFQIGTQLLLHQQVS